MHKSVFIMKIALRVLIFVYRVSQKIVGYVFWLKMAGRVFSVTSHFSKLCDTYTVFRKYTGLLKRLA